MTKAFPQEPKKDPDPHEEFHEVDDLWFQIFDQLLANRNTRAVRVLRLEDLVESRSRSAWRFLATAFLLAAGGLTLIALIELSRPSETIWPWPKSAQALLVAVFVLILLALVHSYRQQRDLVVLRRQLLLSERNRTQQIKDTTGSIPATHFLACRSLR